MIPDDVTVACGLPFKCRMLSSHFLLANDLESAARRVTHGKGVNGSRACIQNAAGCTDVAGLIDVADIVVIDSPRRQVLIFVLLSTRIDRGYFLVLDVPRLLTRSTIDYV